MIKVFHVYVFFLIRNSLERIPGYLNDLGEKVPNIILQKCYYEGVFYDDGTQWESSHTQCQMCRQHISAEIQLPFWVVYREMCRYSSRLYLKKYLGIDFKVIPGAMCRSRSRIYVKICVVIVLGYTLGNMQVQFQVVSGVM